jgi:hypothetical protein
MSAPRPQLEKTPSKAKPTAGNKKTSRWNSAFPVLAIVVVTMLGLFGSAGWFVWRSFAGHPEIGATPPNPLLAGVAPAPAAVKEPSYTEDLQPFIKQYCGDCHSNGSQEGDFAFDRYASLNAIKKDRGIWTKVLRLIELGAMPPAAATQPSSEERQKAAEWLNHQLFFVDCAAEQNPGRVTLRRLNRTEYNNTIRDLLGVDFKPAKDFPSDDVGYGFDNIGDVLTVPPLLVEKYLTAAEEITRRSIPNHGPAYVKNRVTAEKLKSEGGAVGKSSGEKVLASTGRLFRTFEFPKAGSYVIQIEARQDAAGKDPAKMEVKLGGKTLKTFSVKNTTDLAVFEVKLHAAAGKQELSAAFINDFYDEKAKKKKDRNLRIGSMQVEGPLGITDEDRKAMPFVKAVPKAGTSIADAARKNLQEFLPRAFRRPVTPQEVDRYVQLVEMSVKHGESFDEAMGVSLQAILISPHFLFRVEGGRRQEDKIESLDDFALASRLSYFLWSSMPDEELIQLASENRLHEPQTLKQQTLRLLKDPRAQALIENFSGQWLGLRKLSTNEVEPDAKLFPEFNKDIRQDFWKETELFFGSVVRGDGSIYDLLNGKYTFLNERLAKFYGIDGITGENFQRVDLQGKNRAGVITQGSVLTLTSYPNRTSPVKRGEWVLSNILGTPPPDPPPVVPALDETQTANPDLSFRQQLLLHRADPGCAACHLTMDDIGFGLQNFDAIGRWRTKDGKHDIDSTGTLPSGEKFDGPDQLITILSQHREQFARCLTEKLMTFATGRGVEWYDRCAVDEVLRELDKNDRFSTLVLGIVNSAPFQSRRILQPAQLAPASVASQQ